MKVMVLNPPSKVTKNVARDLLWGCWCKGKRIAGITFPPLPLLYVATVLKEDLENEVRFLDAAAERLGFEEIVQETKGVDLLVLNTSTMSFVEDEALLRGLKDVHPNLSTLVFGTHPTYKPVETVSKPGIDIAVRREAEFVVRDLVRAMNRGEEAWKTVNGIAFKNGPNIQVNPYYPDIHNLDDLPIADRTLLPKNFEYYNPVVKRIPATTALSSRGCPARCTFCTAPSFYGSRYRSRTPANVLRELEILTDLGYKEVFFRDEEFSVVRERVVEICQGILDKGLDVSWICSTRVDTVDLELLKLMKAAGCHMIRTGVESGVQQLLDNVRKGATIEQARQVYDWCHYVGIDTHAHMMIGIPGETKNTIRETIQFVKEIDPTIVTFGITTPYPGTLHYRLVSQIMGDELGDGSVIDLRTLHTNGHFNEAYTSLSAEELGRYQRRAYREFYLRPSYLIRSIGRIRSLDELRRVTLAGAEVLDFIINGE